MRHRDIASKWNAAIMKIGNISIRGVGDVCFENLFGIHSINSLLHDVFGVVLYLTAGLGRFVAGWRCTANTSESVILTTRFPNVSTS